MPGRVVVDASVCVELVLPLRSREPAYYLIRDWEHSGIGMYAPSLWFYEVCSTVRKHIVSGLIPEGQAESSLDHLLSLGVELLPPTRQLGLRAIAWSERTNQRVVYDAAYLALADDMACPLWTADRRLYRAARSAGAEWVHLVGEGE
ncbi:MAG: type II toxin-antitoxin system VapC family toxin [Anaerolineae bacterium]